MFYILVDKKPVETNDIELWFKSFKDFENMKVKHDHIGKIFISTVFLGIDHYVENNKPLLFETMIFGLNEEEGYMERYSTWEEAEIGHQKAINYVLNR